MDPFLGEIRAFSFNWAPKGWQLCDGTLLAISQNQPLFALLGTRYGGDGRTTFGVPDLRGRVSVSAGTSPSGTPYAQGQSGGAETVTLTVDELGAHSHVGRATTNGADLATPDSGVFATPNLTDFLMYGQAVSLTGLVGSTIGQAGNGQDHANVQPTAVVNYCISLSGAFPPRQ